MSLFAASLITFTLTIGALFTYLAIKSRDLLKATIFSAAQSATYALIFFLLMAPDIVLAYIAVAIGIYTVILLYIISKTERYEEVES
ncbi:MAG: hydrogenase subunit MbhD domain-containing protein [Candidatus Nezhaarchaeales archaeon]|nr:MAG: sodium:proton antiporter [Candidatus Nezhaarchaeota archaeon WYZ-LMO8]TDA37008.1 MAG: sodium:proton antiporter [Candidatus Nezhaarchaeota archaeon WYZ-LMO7]